MCTGLTLTTNDGYHLFGRSMDIEYSFNQSPLFIPRNFTWNNAVTKDTNKIKYAILGMGTMLEGHPMIADAFNEKGLACAGLNFPGYASYEENIIDGKINIGPYDLILWVLSNFEKVSQVKEALENLNIVNIPFTQSTPLPTLHWIVYDKNDDCIVIEKVKGKLNVYDNKVGILTNSPTFDWHITNLRQYMGLTSTQPPEATWHKQELIPLGQGLGLCGLPGDFSPASRFVRTSYFKSHIALNKDELSGVTAFFHILANVSMIGGSVVTPANLNDITLYKSSMCLEKGTYYYNTYYNNQITVINMHNEDLDATEVKVFPYRDAQSIYYEN